MDGFLLIDKPSGLTSHDVVVKVRKLLASSFQHPVSKVGHAGTLDPLATGLLIVGVGAATKKLGTLLKLPKTYEAELTLGATSTTDDAEGVIEGSRIGGQGTGIVPPRADVERELSQFIGITEQIPPVYSAVKVRGVPAHRRTRRGETVALSPRRVTVHAAKLLSFAYPHARIRWTVSSGTYIRSLARDLGDALGTGAYLSALRRTAIGPFTVAEAKPLDAIASAALVPMSDTLDRLVSYERPSLV